MNVFGNGRRLLLSFFIMLVPLAGTLWLTPAPVLGQDVFTCPAAPIDFCSDRAGQICVPLPIPGADSVKVAGDPAAQWANDQLCFSVINGGVYHFTVTVYAPGGEQTCDISVNVSIGQPPTIICPQEPLRVHLCSPGEVCLLMATRGAGQVVAAGARYENGNLCFQADTSGDYRFAVVARNACGADTCMVEAIVTVGRVPVITCPDNIFDMRVCSLDRICVPLDIQAADSIQVSNNGEWSDGMLCFTPDTVGSYSFDIAATSDCGSAHCSIRVDVSLTPKPVIYCPPGPIHFTLCSQRSIGIAVHMDNEGPVEVSGGATWKRDTLYFTPDTAGSYNFHIATTNGCGQASCDVTVEIAFSSLPQIACPTEPLLRTVCGAEQLCIPIEISGAVNIVSSIGTYADGSLCFTPDSSGTYLIHLGATNQCGESTCDFTLTVQRREQPTIECPTEPLAATTCSHTACVPLKLSTTWTDSVVATGATLTDDNLCFAVTETGIYKIPVTAFGPCGQAACTLQVNVTVPPQVHVERVDSTLKFSLCGPEQICVGLGTENTDSVTVTGGAWDAETQHACFQATEAGEHVLTVIGYGRCNNDTSVIHVVTEFMAAPVITCPQQPLVGTICKAGEACVDLPIASATQVTVEGATWKDDRLCFQADSSGTYHFAVTASNRCHQTSCSVTVQVQIADILQACFHSEYGGTPLTVRFSNCTTPAGALSYRWNFGDGQFSTEYAPVHSFARPGCYPVTLSAVGFCGDDTLYASVTDTLCVQDSNLVVPTDQWISAYCAYPTLDGEPLKPGDIIAAYDPQGVLCGLDSIRSGGAFGFMPIYRDDQYSDLDEGAVPGDTISFAINGRKVYTQPAVIWTANGDRFQVCTFLSQLCTNLVLHEGWNLVSWNVPLSGDIAAVFADQMACIDLILSYDRGGLTFDPDMTRFSTLSQVDYYHGYWIKVKPDCTVTLKLCGAALVSGEIPIYQGWNLVSYWPDHTLPVDAALASLSENLEGAWGFDGAPLVYKPGMTDFNTLDSLHTYFGYWVKSGAPGMLVYPGFALPGFASTPSDQGQLDVAPSRVWMSLYGEAITLDGRPLVSGTVISAYTDNGVLSGRGTYSNGLLKFTPVYGRDDADAATKLYAASGDQVVIYVDGHKTGTSVRWQGDGTPTRISALTSAAGDGQVPHDFGLAQNYPNPFNPSTNIDYSVPVTSRVVIEIFNVAGQVVTTLVNQTVEAGTHTVSWFGQDAAGNPVASGIYFYRLRAGTYSETRKMTLLK